VGSGAQKLQYIGNCDMQDMTQVTYYDGLIYALSDLKRPKRHYCRNGKVLRSPPEKCQRGYCHTISGKM